jgi:hypothetical protein
VFLEFQVLCCDAGVVQVLSGVKPDEHGLIRAAQGFFQVVWDLLATSDLQDLKSACAGVVAKGSASLKSVAPALASAQTRVKKAEWDLALSEMVLRMHLEALAIAQGSLFRIV